MRPPVARGQATPRKSRRAEAERQPTLALDGMEEPEAYTPPPLALLQKPVSLVRHKTSDVRAGRERPHARDRARGLWRARRDRRRAPWARRHALRAGARARPQGQPRHRAGRRHRAVDVGAGRPRLDGARPLDHRHRAAECRARARLAARPLRDDRVRRRPLSAGAGARQGHLGLAHRREPRQDAASADRRHHRLGQVGGDQHDDPVAALPPRARSSAG